jgi:selenide,water dikinase
MAATAAPASYLHRRFVERGVHLHLQESVCEIELVGDDQRRVRCESGLTVECDRVFWVTNASSPGWIQGSGLATDDHGFLLVKDTLQSTSHPHVFAAGDVATMQNHPRPKAGVFAVRQGPPLFENLQAFLKGESLKPFTPQKQYLNIIDTGDGSAIASRGPFTFESKLMRAWKDRIDQKFMSLFSDFPEMEEQSRPVQDIGRSPLRQRQRCTAPGVARRWAAMCCDEPWRDWETQQVQ